MGRCLRAQVLSEGEPPPAEAVTVCVLNDLDSDGGVQRLQRSQMSA
jgi:hypothetical protein